MFNRPTNMDHNNSPSIQQIYNLFLHILLPLYSRHQRTVMLQQVTCNKSCFQNSMWF